MKEDVVSIRKRVEKKEEGRPASAFMADKIFVVGMVIGFVSMAIIGAVLWLGLNGQVSLPSRYFIWRAAHATLQIHFFVGLFILGFLMQAAPKLLLVSVPLSPATKFLFPVLILSFLAYMGMMESVGMILASLVYLGAALSLVPLVKKAAKEDVERVGIPCIVGTVSLGIGSWFDLSSPIMALALFWWGVVSVILGVAPQFIAGVLGGSKLELRESRIVSALFVLTGLTILNLTVIDSSLLWVAFSALSVATFAAYLYFTKIFRAVLQGEVFKPFAVGFLISWVWAFVGALLAAEGAGAADATLHAWGIGFATTMIIAVSSRVIGYVTMVEVIPERLFLSVLAVWQLVPIGRSLRHIFSLPPFFSWLVVGSTVLVLGAWLTGIARAIKTMIMRKRALQ